MAQGKVEICGVNTASLPVLGEEEKEALFARIKEGDQEAKEEYTLWRQRGEPGRSLPDRLHRAYQGSEQF